MLTCESGQLIRYGGNVLLDRHTRLSHLREHTSRRATRIRASSSRGTFAGTGTGRLAFSEGVDCWHSTLRSMGIQLRPGVRRIGSHEALTG